MKAIRRRLTGIILATALFSAISPVIDAQSTLTPPPPPPLQAASVQGKSARADSLLLAGNLLTAIAEYEKLFPGHGNDYNVLYNYASALSRAGRCDSSLKYLYRAVKTEPSLSVLADPHFQAVRDLKEWELFENWLISEVNISTGNTVKDAAFAKSLLRLLCLDQTGFYEMGIAVSTFGPVSPVVTALRSMQSLQNEKNIKELQALIDLKGWPERSQVGPLAASAAFFVIQHSNALTQEKYLGMFEAACRKGEGNWHQYALMFDRMRMNQGKPQRFGTHAYLDPGKGSTNELYPLEDETRVDEWRKEIGLEPLKDYLIRTNIKYNRSIKQPVIP